MFSKRTVTEPFFMKEFNKDNSQLRDLSELSLKVISNKNDNSPVYSLLKEYRLRISKEEGIKAFMVFSNQELDSLVQNKPKNKRELLQVKGFGEKKVEKYGEAILSILNCR